MPRCDYESGFYRVFCATLLAVALAFTIVLANVFIDIDTLIAGGNKDKGKPQVPILLQVSEHNKEDKEIIEQNDIMLTKTLPEGYKEFTYNKDEGNEDFLYRSKRSLDQKTFQFHLKNPKMKEILTHKLATLLDELDAEETKKTDKAKIHEASHAFEKLLEDNNANMKKKIEIKQTEDDMLHLAMHNILLQGIIGHMDFNDVYMKVHELMKNFENGKRVSEKKPDHSVEELSPDIMSENKFFQELIKCRDLQRQVMEAAQTPLNTRRSFGGQHSKRDSYKTDSNVQWEKKSPHMLIKTVIDIKTLKNDKNNTSINENNIKGVIKLIYNGKPIKFSRLEEEELGRQDIESRQEGYDRDNDIRNRQEATRDVLRQEDVLTTSDDVVDNFIDKAISNYIKMHPKLESKFKNKRLKRNVKIRVKEVNTTDKPKSKSHKKKEDEDLYVEIETHFDSKGVKADKKKRIIKNIVEKIQKAIHADLIDTKHKKHGLTVKKRNQTPLEVKTETVLKNKIIIPMDDFEHREMQAISKTVKQNEGLPKVYDKSGEEWKKTYYGSKFLSLNKAINSGETGQVDLDYSKVIKNSGIPQRLQQPLNTDILDETEEQNYFNMGDLKFYIKEIDGTGFSIGFNQYVGEAPDPESIKLFTGLQQLIDTYHQNYDDTDRNGQDPEKNSSLENAHDVKKRDANSGYFELENEANDPHTNEYKVIFDKNYLPYDSYSEIIEDQNKKVKIAIQKDNRPFKQNKINREHKQTAYSQIVVDDNIFEKNLKPSEIFGIASLLDTGRKKRSAMIKVKKFASLNTKKNKINRFLNTNKKTKRILVSNTKRSKRDIDKIRIIATDTLPALQRHSGENIFVVSEENNDQNAVREVEVPEHDDPEVREDVNRIQYEQPATFFNQYAAPHHYNIFTARSRHNALMSKYPHLFLEEVGRSKEEESPLFYNRLLNTYAGYNKNRDADSVTPLSIPIPNAGIGPIAPELAEVLGPNANYKLTVKITPKNVTDLHTGFKEIHTTINKSINRNGLVYSSQVNVSEVSKVENANGKNGKDIDYFYPLANLTRTLNLATEKNYEVSSYYPLVKHIKEQQEKMKQLLKQHRKRIDEQLNTLNKEKQNIETIIVPDNEDKKKDIIDIVLPINPQHTLHLNKAEAGQIITSALLKLNDASKLNDNNYLETNCSKQLKLDNTTERKGANNPPIGTTVEPEKLKLFKTIQRNENLTNIILYKIDKNTNLLQVFLQKLSDRLDPVLSDTRRSTKSKEKTPYMQPPFFGQNLPNFEFHKNGSQVIPFVYAYQQPYPLPDKSNDQVASVVYQGHIHTNANTLKNKFNKKVGDGKEKTTDKREAHPKFFFDENKLS